MLCNRIQLADILGVSAVTVDVYVKAGMPGDRRNDKSRSGEWIFDTKIVIKWMIDRSRKKDGSNAFGGEKWQDARARDRTAAASLRELELRKALGELITVDVVIEHVEKEYAVIKSKLRAIPSRLAQLIAVEPDPEVCEDMLKREVSDVLTALSDPGDLAAAAANSEA